MYARRIGSRAAVSCLRILITLCVNDPLMLCQFPVWAIEEAIETVEPSPRAPLMPGQFFRGIEAFLRVEAMSVQCDKH